MSVALGCNTLTRCENADCSQGTVGRCTLAFRCCSFPGREEWRPTCWNRDGLYRRFSNAFFILHSFWRGQHNTVPLILPFWSDILGKMSGRNDLMLSYLMQFNQKSVLFLSWCERCCFFGFILDGHWLTSFFSGLQTFTHRMWSNSQSMGLSLWNIKKNSAIIGRSWVRNILPGGQHIQRQTCIQCLWAWLETKKTDKANSGAISPWSLKCWDNMFLVLDKPEMHHSHFNQLETGKTMDGDSSKRQPVRFH